MGKGNRQFNARKWYLDNADGCTLGELADRLGRYKALVNQYTNAETEAEKERLKGEIDAYGEVWDSTLNRIYECMHRRPREGHLDQQYSPLVRDFISTDISPEKFIENVAEICSN